ncbi:c-type cytochrome [Flexithrix dorotheae]|uniref:c-type cytochrome n=1 Tax=Flexithrix dorotheae TaxID=70993 RepID=UPI00037E6972|nr:cytochrome c [Flexithrix dorotheae]
MSFIHQKDLTGKTHWDENKSLAELLQKMGDSLKNFKPDHLDTELIERGEEIIRFGKTTAPSGKSSKYISKYYNCVSCHNSEIEDPDLKKSDPEVRLAFANSENIPFLQASTFYGMVNRESWYNGDYIKKYGDLVIEANKDITAAVQLCAVECSQGRKVEDWEMDAIMAYLWSLEYRLGDLGLQESDFKKLNEEYEDKANHDALIKWIKSFYLQASPATFADPPESRKGGFEQLVGNPKNGQLIFEKSCLHCHDENGVTKYTLEDNKLSFKKLKKDMAKSSQLSLYHAIRYGTKPEPGHKPYMPQYTLERMSNQQIEDFRAYVEVMAKGEEMNGK